MRPLPPQRDPVGFAPFAPAPAGRQMRVGYEMYWAVVAPGATLLRRMWLLGLRCWRSGSPPRSRSSDGS